MSLRSRDGGTIVLVGRRNGALRAAKRLGLKTVVIDVPARREQFAQAFGGTADWATDAAVRAFSEKGTNPVAAVGVATGSSVAAAAVRERFGLPGISSASARRCHDKLVMKRAAAAAGIACAPWLETGATTRAKDLVDRFGLPVVLKLPVSSGGRGVWVCPTLAEVEARLASGLLAEGFISGTEMSVETFRAGGKTLLWNPTSYVEPAWASVVPAPLGEGESRSVAALVEKVHDAFEISSGITHMEVFLTSGGPVFGEIAARPPGGYIMELIDRAYGFDPWEILLRTSLGETPWIPAVAGAFAGVWMLYPDAGTVREVTGLDEARTMEGVVEIACHVAPGDRIVARGGSGDSKGKVVAVAGSYDRCTRALTSARAKIGFTVGP